MFGKMICLLYQTLSDRHHTKQKSFQKHEQLSKKKVCGHIEFFLSFLLVPRLLPCARREELSAVCFPKFCFFCLRFRIKDMAPAQGSVFCMLKVWAMSLPFHSESNCLCQVNKQIQKFQERHRITEREAILKAWLCSSFFSFFNDDSIQSCEAFHYYLQRRDYNAVRICRLKLRPVACSFLDVAISNT
jgi:hypothetical protein